MEGEAKYPGAVGGGEAAACRETRQRRPQRRLQNMLLAGEKGMPVPRVAGFHATFKEDDMRSGRLWTPFQAMIVRALRVPTWLVSFAIEGAVPILRSP